MVELNGYVESLMRHSDTVVPAAAQCGAKGSPSMWDATYGTDRLVVRMNMYGHHMREI